MGIDRKRRSIVQGLTGLMAASSLTLPWPLHQAMASTRSNLRDYKAVICVFLNGGNDGNDTLIPLDGAYQDYAKYHGMLTLPKEDLLPLSLANSDHVLGLHPALQPLQSMTDRGDIAWIANAGPLLEPVTAADVRNGTARVPSFLGSHPDQQRLVSGGVPGTFAANSGWGGRALENMPEGMLDELLSNLALNEDNWLMRGQNWAPTGAEDREYFNSLDLRYILSGGESRDFDAYQEAVRFKQGMDDLSYAYTSAVGNVLDEVLELRRVLDLVPSDVAPHIRGENMDGGLMERLRTAVRVFWSGREMGIKRQMIFLDWGGFDTHAKQRGITLRNQDGQLKALADGLSDLDAQIKNAGLHDQVVTMVMSEFGRPLVPNSGGGTDHGWGNHFWVMGGPVNGNRLYGQMPTLVPGGPDDMGDDASGRWVPTTHSDQIAASVMEWFGLPRSAFPDVFAHLQNFPNQTLDMF